MILGNIKTPIQELVCKITNGQLMQAKWCIYIDLLQMVAAGMKHFVDEEERRIGTFAA